VAQSNCAWLHLKGLSDRAFLRAGDAAVNATLRLLSARRMLERAAQQGGADSHLRLGDMDWYGMGRARNISAAAAHYAMAAGLRSQQGAYSLAYLHQFGVGVPRNHSAARRLFKRAGSREHLTQYAAQASLLLLDAQIAAERAAAALGRLPLRGGAPLFGEAQLHRFVRRIGARCWTWAYPSGASSGGGAASPQGALEAQGEELDLLEEVEACSSLMVRPPAPVFPAVPHRLVARDLMQRECRGRAGAVCGGGDHGGGAGSLLRLLDIGGAAAGAHADTRRTRHRCVAEPRPSCRKMSWVCARLQRVLKRDHSIGCFRFAKYARGAKEAGDLSLRPGLLGRSSLAHAQDQKFRDSGQKTYSAQLTPDQKPICAATLKHAQHQGHPRAVAGRVHRAGECVRPDLGSSSAAPPPRMLTGHRNDGAAPEPALCGNADGA